jgi:two-component system, NtrC family, sensor kinase
MATVSEAVPSSRGAEVRAPPRKTVARRVLASFAVTVIAFAVTVGWSGVAQKRAAEDSEELAKGYLRVALELGQLRATQATLSTLVDGIPDERDPLSTRLLLETLTSARRTQFARTRKAVGQELPEVGSPATRALAASLATDLAAAEDALADDHAAFDLLFGAIDAGDKDGVNRDLVAVGAMEHDADKRLHALSDRVKSSMDELSAAAHAREVRAIYALFILSLLTLGVGVLVSVHISKLLAPLGRVTERAQAVARGDLTPRAVVPTEDEIGELAAAFERMVAAVARAQSRAVANERLAAIGKMAAHVTHEIRNPLSSIGLNIELLEEELAKQSPRSESLALLSAIAREVERLGMLSEEYLRVARLPSPRMEAEDIATTVKAVVEFARPEIERAGCTVKVSVDDDLPPALFDEAQIRQALVNLLRNAREAMPAGGAIDVRVLADGMSVAIDIDDRGGGIPDDIRARVFDPFFSTKGEGTGLGLAITRQIVEAHGGTIACDAREGGGTRLRITLPIAPSRASGAKVPRSAGRV